MIDKIKPIKESEYSDTAKRHIAEYGLNLTGRLVHVYYLTKALAIELEHVREFMNPEYRAIVSEAKAKNNHFAKKIEGVMSKTAVEQTEEDAYEMLEALYAKAQEINKRYADKKIHES